MLTVTKKSGLGNDTSLGGMMAKNVYGGAVKGWKKS